MLYKLVRAELLKLKRSPVWIAFLLMPIVPAVLGTMNYLANLSLLQSEYYSLWTQHTLFTCYFFLPILIGVYCSQLIRQEQNNHNWNRMLTMPAPRSMLFAAKMILVSLMILLSEVWIGILFVLSGKLVGIAGAVPVKELVTWCILGTLGGMVMASVQLMISLFIKSFALPVGISLVGGISGMLFLAKDLGHIWPYSLMAYGMNSNSPQQIMASGYLPFVITCVLYITLFTTISSIILARRDF